MKLNYGRPAIEVLEEVLWLLNHESSDTIYQALENIRWEIEKCFINEDY